MVGLALLVVGFLLVMPRDSTPGSISNRQVRQGSIGLVGTPGHDSSPDRSARTRIIIGVILLVAGLLLMFLI